MMLKVILLFSLVTNLCLAGTIGQTNEHADYSGYKLVKIFPQDEKDLAYLSVLKEEEGLDFWSELRHDLQPVLTHLSPDQSSSILANFNHSSIPYEIVSNNLQSIIDGERAEMIQSRDTLGSFNYDSEYHNLEDIEKELGEVEAHKDYSKLAKPFTIGQSFEKHSIQGIKITNPSTSVASKRAVVMECGIHAREWISPASCLWIVKDLISNPENKERLDKFEFHIVPVLNVDGYKFTHKNNRLWRKSRRPSSKQDSCIGADINRNFDVVFCETGASRSPCSDTYCGDAAFSEIESKSMADYVKGLSDVAAYFSIHSYSQLWMFPWGYTTKSPPNYAELDNLSTLAAKAVTATHGMTYRHGQIPKILYAVSGSSIDYMYDKLNIKRTFAIELRDTGRHGFILPKDQIKPTAEELWAGLKAVLSQI